tara:strand:- start:2113 stop:2223 length:111 start_codon:yes stop_codon:yes gene_type:complete
MYSIIDSKTGDIVHQADIYADALQWVDRCERWALIY